MSRTPYEDTRLADVKHYVERHGQAYAQVLERSEWDVLTDHDREAEIYRLKDKTSIPTRGVAIALSADVLRYMEADQINDVVGNLILEHLKRGLPVKKPAEPYFLEIIAID